MSKEFRNMREEEKEKAKGKACDETLEQEVEVTGEAGQNEGKNLEVKELQEKLDAANDKYLRLSAEFDNYRKRTLKEKMELTKSAGEQILEKILPVMDNFERALQSMETATDVPALREGVQLIYTTFKDFLTQHGVKEIECIHTEFNPDLQEAVTKIPAPAEELKGKVVDCIQKGYMLHDKVIRFPKVVVGE